MAKTVIVKLTDDIDGGDADETIQVALDGKTYEVDRDTPTRPSFMARALAVHREGEGNRRREPCPLATPE